MESKVSALEVARSFGRYADKALVNPVHVTKHGREHVVLISEDEYNRLKSRDRVAFAAEDTPADLLAALQRTDDLPIDTPNIAAEAKDWKL